MDASHRQLLELLGEVSDLGRARALLAWDERTQMPPGGAEARAEQVATLAKVRHERLTSPGLWRLLEELRPRAESLPPDSDEASLVRVARREFEKASKVPVELRAEIARTTSLAEHAWVKAREASDFPALRPHLERILELANRYVECFAPYEHRYDPLLDDYEPGMRTAELRPVLEELRDGLAPLVAAIAERADAVDDSCLHGDFPIEAQEALAQRVLDGLPLGEGEWRLDPTVHPFATAIAVNDIRITTRYDQAHLSTGLWSVLHEAGHAIYDNGYPLELERTPLCRGASLGFHESQSRMWENWVGRGRPYLGHLRPLLVEHFPERFQGVDDEELYRAANRVERSLIRVEADEVTYNLHVIIRFELEVEMIEGHLALADLPEAWNARYAEYLGLEVPDDAHGVLQDVHWAAGSLGYFPTYSLGNVIAAQLWNAAQRDLPDLDDQLARGELVPLRDFLRERVHRHGFKFMPAELIHRAIGGPLSVGPLIEHLEEKFGEIYGL
jgi:carboxypeptidase Taq